MKNVCALEKKIFSAQCNLTIPKPILRVLNLQYQFQDDRYVMVTKVVINLKSTQYTLIKWGI